MKSVTILGARPQFIKAAPMSRAAASNPDFTDLIVHTGQHYDANMSNIFFQELGIPKPAYHLGIGGGTHGQMTGRQLEAVEGVLLQEKPDIVIVYGDTNSTLAGALAAAKLNIPIGHVEAGLRSFNRRMPEEINRVMTDHISTWCFAPTARAVTHLDNEGIPKSHISQVGDVMCDAARIFGEEADTKSKILEELSLEKGGFYLSTVHRQENTDHPERIAAILEALATLSSERTVVLPLHPRTRKIIENSSFLKTYTDKLKITGPLGFFDIIALMRGAGLVLTDSGGMQKEAYFHKTPVVILRDETEWVELVDIGAAELAPPDSVENILNAASKMVGQQIGHNSMPYGDGHAAKKIIEIIS